MLSLSFAKLVATPTETSWSQVYNAGNLFASLSLSKEADSAELSLNSIGKEMFTNLEAEFFSLETKDLRSIKEAIANSTHIIPSGVAANLCLAFFKENILYLFIFGAGKILMKRHDKTGVLLEVKPVSLEIVASSGLMEQDDTIVLETPQFAKDMPLETISGALELNLPNDIAEALSPAMHERNDGGQAAIIINYKEAPKAVYESPETEDEIILKAPIDDFPSETEAEITAQTTTYKEERTESVLPVEHISSHTPKNSSLSKLRLPAFLSGFGTNIFKKTSLSGLDHRKKIFLSVAILIVAVLALSIFFTRSRQEQTKTTALFNSVYDPALRDYEDGLGVLSINKEFARIDFLKSQKLLNDNKEKFKKGTKEEKQISELLSKVEKELGGESTQSSKVEPKAVTPPSTDLLSVEKDNPDGIAFTADKDTVDFLTEKAVVSVNKSGDKKDLIKNDSDWEKGVGISTYQGNIYILDQKDGVLKFTAGSDGFGKSSYLKDKPDLSTASAIAIDGSVWILLKDGNILKYTKGVADGLKIKGMDKSAKGATRIFTNIDTENLYVLDPGNSRIIKINKEGAFQTQYVADILKDAKDLEVSEKDGKITILSDGKFWEIPL